MARIEALFVAIAETSYADRSSLRVETWSMLILEAVGSDEPVKSSSLGTLVTCRMHRATSDLRAKRNNYARIVPSQY